MMHPLDVTVMRSLAIQIQNLEGVLQQTQAQLEEARKLLAVYEAARKAEAPPVNGE